jgi:hypothetical protein
MVNLFENTLASPIHASGDMMVMANGGLQQCECFLFRYEDLRIINVLVAADVSDFRIGDLQVLGVEHHDEDEGRLWWEKEKIGHVYWRQSQHRTTRTIF